MGCTPLWQSRATYPVAVFLTRGQNRRRHLPFYADSAIIHLSQIKPAFNPILPALLHDRKTRFNLAETLQAPVSKPTY